MGEGVWLDSEKLGWNDEVREVLKHGTLCPSASSAWPRRLQGPTASITARANAAQKLGLKIIGHMRATA